MLTTHHAQKSIDELVTLYKRGRLNLSPAFQRQSVWSNRDRQLLVESILGGVPLPSVYLYQQVGARGNPKYDVIDGKQRIETILLFMGAGPLAPSNLRAHTPSVGGKSLRQSWDELDKETKNQFLTTKIATIEVKGGLNEITDLFVRINSTGKRLTNQETRHAHFHDNLVLRTAQTLADKHHEWFVKQGILSAGQMRRMKHVELMTELLLAVEAGKPLNKKTSIDKIMSGASLGSDDLRVAAISVQRSLSLVKAVLPELRTTRFHNGSDFYSLALLLHTFWLEGKTITLHDSKRNALAGSLLREFGNNVDEAKDQIADGKGLRHDQGPFRDYLFTVRADADSSKTRRTREGLLRDVLDGVFDYKDATRVFNATQRRIVWHASSRKKCCFCRQPINTWDDMAVDHVVPHSSGGPTMLKNAAIAHRKCNSAAGAKRKSKS